MKNRIKEAWRSIEDETLRERVRDTIRARAQACRDMLPESSVSLRTISAHAPSRPDHIDLLLVLYVGKIPAVVLASSPR